MQVEVRVWKGKTYEVVGRYPLGGFEGVAFDGRIVPFGGSELGGLRVQTILQHAGEEGCVVVYCKQEGGAACG
jgi:hypothetical protein